jgi:hypothetical protein
MLHKKVVSISIMLNIIRIRSIVLCLSSQYSVQGAHESVSILSRASVSAAWSIDPKTAQSAVPLAVGIAAQAAVFAIVPVDVRVVAPLPAFDNCSNIPRQEALS